ncbi:MAG: DNA starvation/stationary phase protection protein [Pseudomonadota bacterium]
MTLSILETKTINEPKPQSGLSDEARGKLAKDVLEILSSSYVLMVKTQGVHWNISGPMFKSVHDLTEEQYDDLFEAIDDIAERIRALGLRAPMTYEEMAEMTEIQPFTKSLLSAGQMIQALAADNEVLATHLAKAAKSAADIGDPASEDLFVERLRKHEKFAWMLRTLLAD